MLGSRMSLRSFVFRIVLFLLFIVNPTDHVPSFYFTPSYIRGSLLAWKESWESFYHLILDILQTRSPVLLNNLSIRSDLLKVLTWMPTWFRNVFRYNVTDTILFQQCYNEMANTSIIYKAQHQETQIVTAPTDFLFHNSVTMPFLSRQISSQYLINGSYLLEYVYVLFVVLATVLLLIVCFCHPKIRRRVFDIWLRNRNSVQDPEKGSDDHPTKQKVYSPDYCCYDDQSTEQKKFNRTDENVVKEESKKETELKEVDEKQQKEITEPHNDEAKRKQDEQRKQKERKQEERRKMEEERIQEEKRKQEERRKREEQRQREERQEFLDSVGKCKELGYLKPNYIPKGLPNLGNTCYLNSLLQVLSWTPLLGQKLAEQLWKTVGNEGIDIDFLSMNNVPTRLFLLLRNVHRQTGDGNTLPRDLPLRVLEEARKLNDQFMGYRQQDSFEMFNTLIEGVENEARLAPLQQEAIRRMTDTEELMQKSPVSRLVGGTFVTVWYYESCEHVDLTFQRFTSISVPVPKPLPVQTVTKPVAGVIQNRNCNYDRNGNTIETSDNRGGTSKHVGLGKDDQGNKLLSQEYNAGHEDLNEHSECRKTGKKGKKNRKSSRKNNHSLSRETYLIENKDVLVEMASGQHPTGDRTITTVSSGTHKQENKAISGETETNLGDKLNSDQLNIAVDPNEHNRSATSEMKRTSEDQYKGDITVKLDELNGNAPSGASQTPEDSVRDLQTKSPGKQIGTKSSEECVIPKDPDQDVDTKQYNERKGSGTSENCKTPEVQAQLVEKETIDDHKINSTPEIEKTAKDLAHIAQSKRIEETNGITKPPCHEKHADAAEIAGKDYLGGHNGNTLPENSKITEEPPKDVPPDSIDEHTNTATSEKSDKQVDADLNVQTKNPDIQNEKAMSDKCGQLKDRAQEAQSGSHDDHTEKATIEIGKTSEDPPKDFETTSLDKHNRNTFKTCRTQEDAVLEFQSENANVKHEMSGKCGLQKDPAQDAQSGNPDDLNGNTTLKTAEPPGDPSKDFESKSHDNHNRNVTSEKVETPKESAPDVQTKNLDVHNQDNTGQTRENPKDPTQDVQKEDLDKQKRTAPSEMSETPEHPSNVQKSPAQVAETKSVDEHYGSETSGEDEKVKVLLEVANTEIGEELNGNATEDNKIPMNPAQGAETENVDDRHGNKESENGDRLEVLDEVATPEMHDKLTGNGPSEKSKLPEDPTKGVPTEPIDEQTKTATSEQFQTQEDAVKDVQTENANVQNATSEKCGQLKNTAQDGQSGNLHDNNGKAAPAKHEIPERPTKIVPTESLNKHPEEPYGSEMVEKDKILKGSAQVAETKSVDEHYGSETSGKDEELKVLLVVANTEIGEELNGNATEDNKIPMNPAQGAETENVDDRHGNKESENGDRLEVLDEVATPEMHDKLTGNALSEMSRLPEDPTKGVPIEQIDEHTQEDAVLDVQSENADVQNDNPMSGKCEQVENQAKDDQSGNHNGEAVSGKHEIPESPTKIVPTESLNKHPEEPYGSEMVEKDKILKGPAEVAETKSFDEHHGNETDKSELPYALDENAKTEMPHKGNGEIAPKEWETLEESSQDALAESRGNLITNVTAKTSDTQEDADNVGDHNGLQTSETLKMPNNQAEDTETDHLGKNNKTTVTENVATLENISQFTQTEHDVGGPIENVELQNDLTQTEEEYKRVRGGDGSGSSEDGQQSTALILPHQPLEAMNENPTDLERGLMELTEVETWDECMIGCRSCDSSDSDTIGKYTHKKLLIIDLPPVLVVHINKMEKDGYGGLRKVNRTVTYPKYLNMAPFCSSALQKIEVEYPTVRAWFRLYGVVSHGGSIHGGHYTAYVRVSHQNGTSLHKHFLQTQWTDPEQVEDDIKKFWEENPHSHSTVPTEGPRDTTVEDWYHVSDSMFWRSDEKAATNDRDAYILMYERCGQ